MDFDLPNNIISWITLIGSVLTILIGGGLAVFYFFGKEYRQKRNQQDEAEDRLVKILQDTIDAQNVKVTGFETELAEQGELIHHLDKKIGKLEKENEILTKILQGRDQDTINFQKAVLENQKVAYDLIKENIQLHKQHAEDITQLYKSIEGYMKKRNG